MSKILFSIVALGLIFTFNIEQSNCHDNCAEKYNVNLPELILKHGESESNSALSKCYLGCLLGIGSNEKEADDSYGSQGFSISKLVATTPIAGWLKNYLVSECSNGADIEASSDECDGGDQVWQCINDLQNVAQTMTAKYFRLLASASS